MSEHDFGVDVPERQQAQRRMDELFRALIENALDVITILDAEGVIRYQSPSVERVLGYKPAELIGVNIVELLHPDDVPKVHAAIRAVAPPDGTPGIAQVVEARLRHKDGSWRILEVIGKALPSALPVTGLVVNSRDITARKRAEEALVTERSLLRTLIDHLPDAIYVKDAACRKTLANPVDVRNMGASSEAEALGKTDFDFFPHDLAAVFYADDQSVIQSGRPILNREEMITLPDRTIGWQETSKVPVRDSAGQVIGLVGIGHDITDRKRAEETLRATLTDLQRSNADLQQFAYVASHDLQEPLRMVASYVQLLGMRYQGRLDANADEFIGYAAEGATRMQQLILDLLEYSRISTRDAPLAPTDATVVCQAVLRDLERAIAESRATVVYDPLPTVLVDPAQLAQVFRNLIANSIKFRGTEPPQVHISAQLRSAECGVRSAESIPQSAIGNPQSEWEFAVRDNGIGIAPAYFERIFVIFQRLHTRDAYPGNGIGLAVCKRIIERHGGRIWVESAPGQGSTFFFTLPPAGGLAAGPRPGGADPAHPRNQSPLG